MSSGQSNSAPSIKRCTECGEYDSECVCDDLDRKDAALRQILALAETPNNVNDALDAIRDIARRELGE